MKGKSFLRSIHFRDLVAPFRSVLQSMKGKSLLRSERFQDIVVPFLSVLLGFIVGAILRPWSAVHGVSFPTVAFRMAR